MISKALLVILIATVGAVLFMRFSGPRTSADVPAVVMSVFETSQHKNTPANALEFCPDIVGGHYEIGYPWAIASYIASYRPDGSLTGGRQLSDVHGDNEMFAAFYEKLVIRPLGLSCRTLIWNKDVQRGNKKAQI